MKKRFCCLVGTCFVLALFAAAWAASAAECELQSKFRDVERRAFDPSSPEWLLRVAQPQRVIMNVVTKSVVEDGRPKAVVTVPNEEDNPQLQAFRKVVEKEPKEYVSERPFRGTVTLGDREYGFVFDAVDREASGYGVLFLDRNGNGDLTDDEVIESDAARQYRADKALVEKAKAEAAENQADRTDEAEKDEVEKKTAEAEHRKLAQAKQRLAAGARNRFMYVQYPRIDMKIDVDGEKADYAFFLVSYSYGTRPYAMFTSAVYREGHIELDGKKRHVALVDFNGNGRFDDAGRPGATDMLYVDPKGNANQMLAYDLVGPSCRHNVGKLVCLDGRYYDLKVSPGGNKISLEPSSVAVGQVENQAKNFAALMQGEQGVVKISGTADQPAVLPVGKWTLVGCVIDLTEEAKNEDSEKKATEETAKSPDGTVVRQIVRPSMPKYTSVAASASPAVKPIEVREGETVALPFGPPYHATVDLGYYQQTNDSLYLGLTILGSAGERVTNMMVNGSRPGKPKFKITDPDGKVVVEGDFEYG
ncbi:MAG: hypothetical protein GX621_18265 [Pirellulaceae bacterium]|nr:hypothetical protein [Pirellulaceae bacterium]